MQCTSIVAYNECYTPSKWNFPNITRPFSIIYYVLGGSAYFEINGRSEKMMKDHVYIFPSNKVFSLWEDPNDKFFSVYIHAYVSPEIDELIDLDLSKDQFLFDVFLLIRKNIKNDRIYLIKLIDMLLSYLPEIRHESNIALCHQIKRYVDSDPIGFFSNGDLSGKFNYSSSHLVRIFKNEFNITPRQYAKQHVLKKITDLLGEGRSVNEISDELDFSSPENLTRFFKCEYGYSPTEYKRRFKNFP